MSIELIAIASSGLALLAILWMVVVRLPADATQKPPSKSR